MSKASRVRYSGVALFVDDTGLERIQALGSSTNLSTEDLKELGSLAITEFIDDIPTVDVSIDANEYGSNQTVATMIGASYGCQVVAVPSDTAPSTANIEIKDGSYCKANGTGGYDRIPIKGAVKAITPGSAGNKDVYIIPNADLADQIEIQPVGTGATATGAYKIATFAHGADGVVTSITDARPDSWKKITTTSFELSKADIYVPIKRSGANPNNTITQTMYMENCFVNRYDLNYQVQGVATESFGLETDNKRWFLNSGSRIICDTFYAKSSNQINLSQVPVQLANALYTLKVVKNGNTLKEGVDFTWTNPAPTAPAPDTRTDEQKKAITMTVSLVSTDVVKVRYVASTGGAFFTTVSNTKKAGGLREGQIEIFLKPAGGSEAQLLRCQSVRISLPLTREALTQLGTFRPYERPLQLPIELSVSVEIKDADLEFYAKLAGKDPTTVKEIALTDLLKTMSLIVKIYKEKDEVRQGLLNKYGASTLHPATKPLKIVQVDNLAPTSENWDARVDSDASQTFDFRAWDISITS